MIKEKTKNTLFKQNICAARMALTQLELVGKLVDFNYKSKYNFDSSSPEHLLLTSVMAKLYELRDFYYAELGGFGVSNEYYKTDDRIRFD